jgi:hypothetical protein
MDTRKIKAARYAVTYFRKNEENTYFTGWTSAAVADDVAKVAFLQEQHSKRLYCKDKRKKCGYAAREPDVGSATGAATRSVTRPVKP